MRADLPGRAARAAPLAAALFLAAAAGCDCDARPLADTARTAGPAAVLLELDGPLPQSAAASGLLGSGATTQRRFVELLERASRDLAVQEIVVHIVGPELGWARGREVSDAIARAADAGKPLTCHLEAADNRTYWLAARACPKIVLAPAGGVDLVGLAAETIFARRALDALGVRAEMLRVGRYKDAAESLTRDEMSPESLEATRGLLAELHRELVDGIAAGRELDDAAVEELLASGPYDADQALERGLVDEVRTLGRVLAPLAREHAGGVVEDYGAKPPEPLGLGEILEMLSGAPPPKPRPTEPRIALVNAVGPILSGSGANELLAGMEVVRDGPLVLALDEAARDESIRAVVLRVDSPGGSALASDNIWAAVRDLAEVKPVVASLGDVAASGGYYVASAATEVFASPNTLTGSIGVLGGKLTLSEGLDEIGISTRTIEHSPRAGMASTASGSSRP